MAPQDRDSSKCRSAAIDLQSDIKQNEHWVKFTDIELGTLFAMVNYSRAWVKKCAVDNPKMMANVPIALKEIDKIEDKVLEGTALDSIDNVFGFESF